MAIRQPRVYLVCYDIADPDRLGQVHRILRQAGLPLQYSVFTTALAQADLLALLGEIEAVIAPREDDVRAYPLADDASPETAGKSWLPEGAALFLRGRTTLTPG